LPTELYVCVYSCYSKVPVDWKGRPGLMVRAVNFYTPRNFLQLGEFLSVIFCFKFSTDGYQTNCTNELFFYRWNNWYVSQSSEV